MDRYLFNNAAAPAPIGVAALAFPGQLLEIKVVAVAR